MNSFDKIGLIKQAWEIVKKNVQLIALLVIAFFVYQVVQGIVQGFFGQSALSVLVSLGFTILTLFLQIGFTKILLKLVDGQKAEFQELWAYPQYLFRMIGATIVATIGIGVFIVPTVFLFPTLGIQVFVVAVLVSAIVLTYLTLRFQFYTYYIVDKNVRVLDSFRLSWNATKGNMVNIFLFELLLVGINILGALALVVGLLVTIPLSFIAITLLYRKLAA